MAEPPTDGSPSYHLERASSPPAPARVVRKGRPMLANQATELRGGYHRRDDECMARGIGDEPVLRKGRHRRRSPRRMVALARYAPASSATYCAQGRQESHGTDGTLRPPGRRAASRARVFAKIHWPGGFRNRSMARRWRLLVPPDERGQEAGGR